MRRVAMVTGGASGIGAACCVRLAADGFAVAVCDRDLAGAGRVAADCGGLAVSVDVSDERSVAAAMTVVEGMGPLAVAVNCAAVADDGGAVADAEFAAWRRTLSVDLDGVFLCVRGQLRAMLAAGAGGSIIGMGSVLGLRGHPTTPAYVTAKHALIGLHRSVALRYAADGIRANVVCPGYVDTPLLAGRLDSDSTAALVARHPVGRLGTATEVAALVSWLAGPESSFVTGAVHPIDGGFTS
jgi:NAD(P)-dependent dehydrogenase (short-subunit alcohol dehydrogenase family)